MSKIIKVTKALCLSIALTATSLSANVPASSVETDVLKAEQVRVNAVVNNDYVALQSLLSDDLTYTHYCIPTNEDGVLGFTEVRAVQVQGHRARRAASACI